MFSRPFPSIALAVLLLSGCGTKAPEQLPPAQPAQKKQGVELPPGTVLHLAAQATAPSEYILPADRISSAAPSHQRPLNGSAFGLIIQGRRIVYERGEVKLAVELGVDSLTDSMPIPEHLGQGFLFWSSRHFGLTPGLSMVYRANTWEGALQPIAEVKATINQIAFGLHGFILRDVRGILKEFELPSGALSPLELPGLAHISALPNRRALAIGDFSRVFVSPEGGDGFRERTDVALTSPPIATVVRNGQLWIETQSGKAFRLDDNNSFIEGTLPPDDAAKRVPHERDERWKGSVPPRTHALRFGAPIDAGTAMIAGQGVVARVSLKTGEITDAIAFPAIEKHECELSRLDNDIIGACKNPMEGPRRIASGFLSAAGPKIEKTFDSAVQIFGNSTGEIVAAAPCEDQKPDPWTGCRRSADGKWQSFRIEASAAELAKRVGGSGSSNSNNLLANAKVRWLPLRGAPPKALISAGNTLAILTSTPAGSSAAPPDPIVLEVNKNQLPLALIKSAIENPRNRLHPIDRRFEAQADGSVKGWLDARGKFAAVSISPQGTVTPKTSPIQFQAYFSEHGEKAIALAPPSQFFQSLDHGESWQHLTVPPFSLRNETTAFGPISLCSQVGCDLGTWLRIGWKTPGEPAPFRSTVAPRPNPLPAPTGLPSIACVPAGQADQKTSPFSDKFVQSLGALQFLKPSPSNSRAMAIFTRLLPNPNIVAQHIQSPMNAQPRLFAYYPEAEVFGQKPSPSHIGYQMPFDTESTVRTASLPFSHAGQTDLQIHLITPLLPVNPKESVAYFFMTKSPARFIGTLGPGLNLLAPAGALEPFALQSAVRLPSKEMAVLMTSATGDEHVFRISKDSKTISLLSQRLPGARSFAPANPDALAVTSKGDLFVLRLPSGDEPASPSNPPILIRIGGRVLSPGEESVLPRPEKAPIELAPWSTLRNADDPACTADPEGIRAIIQTEGPWVRVEGRTLPESDPLQPFLPQMTAMVRWNQRRVCLEAIELADKTMRLDNHQPAQSILVARYLPKAEAMHVAVNFGAIRTQPLSCSPVQAGR